MNKLKSVQEKTGSAKEKINNGIAVFRFLREQELIPAVWTKLKTFCCISAHGCCRGIFSLVYLIMANTWTGTGWNCDDTVFVSDRAADQTGF